MSKHLLPNYRCDQCQKLFKYRSNLGKHLRERRCKPFIMVEPEMEQLAEEAAEIAKQQFINMTVNPTRANLIVKNEIKKRTENLKKNSEKEFSMFGLVDDTLAENQFDIISPNELRITKKTTSKVNIKKEKGEEKPTKRAYVKTKPMKIMKRSSIPYKCDLCDFICEKKCQILSHIRHHISSIRHKCLKCFETFSTRMRLHVHSMKNHGRGVIGSAEYSKASSECPICNQLFSEERIKFHMKLHDALTFKCIECEKVFRSEAATEKHFMNSHGNEKRFTCATCGKSFGKLTILKQHEEIHNPIKIYVQCEICSTMMLVKSLKLHMAMKHSDRYKEKRHVCDCGKAFRYNKQLEKHCNSVHVKESRGFVYPCPECEEVFNRRQELREHSFVHYTGKIFECKCGMKFKKRKLLTIHESVHKNLKFPCDFCSLTFQSRGGRRKHHSKVHGQIIEEVLEIPSFEPISADHYEVEFQK